MDVKKIALVLGFLLASGPSLLQAGAHMTIVNADPATSGMNDATPATPVGGNPGTTLGQQRLNAVQRAADIWGGILDSPVEIRIQVRFVSLSCTSDTAVLANSSTIQVVSDFTANAGFPGPEFPGTWYPTALANRRAGRDLMPGNANTNADDITTHINSTLGQTGCGFDWYYGFDNQHGAKVDLIATLLHEFAHGFGFATNVDPSTGIEFQSRPDIFERNILDTTSGKLWTDMTNVERGISATNTGHLVWAGAAVTVTAPTVLEGTPTLNVSAPAAVAGTYTIGLAEFGPAIDATGVSGTLVAALDPADTTGPTTFDACSPITNASAVAGRIALVDRGNCNFVVKTMNAQDAGAIAVVVADNRVESLPPGMAGVDPSITIPTISVSQADGAALRGSLGSTVTVRILLDPTRLAGTDSTGHVRLYAPNPIEPGSSISHWDTTAFPNLLMEPNVSSDLSHGVDLTLPALRDIGWYPDFAARTTPTLVHRTHTPHLEAPRP